MGTQGYLTTVKKGGTPTALTNEPMTNLSGNTYQITDASRRILDRDVVPVFGDQGGSPTNIHPSDIASIDYLFGIVTFNTAKVEPVVVVSGNYMPMSDIAGANNYTLNHAGDVLDDTAYDNTSGNAYRSRVLGLRDVSLSVDRWDQLTQEFFTAINDRTPLIIEVQPGGAGNPLARGWFVPESETHEGDVSSLEAANLVFQVDGDVTADYNWRETP